MADESFAHFRGQVERVIRQARLSATEHEWARRAVEDHRLRDIPLPRVRHQTKAAKVATFLCSTLAYVEVELPERAGELESLVLERLSGREAAPRHRPSAQQTVALSAVTLAFLFAAAGAVPELLGDWPYNPIGGNRHHAQKHRTRQQSSSPGSVAKR